MIDCQMVREVGSFIKDIVDFEGSSLEARFIVKRGVDGEVSHVLEGKIDYSSLITCVMCMMGYKIFSRTLHVKLQMAWKRSTHEYWMSCTFHSW